MKRKTKTDSVREYLEQGNSLTPAEAFERGWGMRLASIICNLKHNHGMNIITNMVTNQYGTRYAKYRLGNLLSTSNNNTNPSKDDEHKVKLLLTMKKYDKIQFKDSLDGERYIRIGYWKAMENDDIDYVEQHSNIKLTPNVVWDDDCGWKYWYNIK